MSMWGTKPGQESRITSTKWQINVLNDLPRVEQSAPFTPASSSKHSQICVGGWGHRHLVASVCAALSSALDPKNAY